MISQAGPSGSAPTRSPPSWLSHIGHGRILYPLFAILNVGLILLVYYYLCRLFFGRSDRNESTTVATAQSSSAASSPSATTRIEASLHPEALSALPVFDYAGTTAAGDEKLECVVCLLEFRDGEKGRLLPRCGHRFHVECVGIWFQSHSTCPICRSTVEVKASGSDEAV